MSGGRQLLDSGQVEERLAPLLRAGAEVPLVVTGSSMVPFLRDRRDTVYLKSPEYAPIRTGDILFFRRESGQWILHRLHHRTAEGLLVINGDHPTRPGAGRGGKDQPGRWGALPRPPVGLGAAAPGVEAAAAGPAGAAAVHRADEPAETQKISGMER